MPIGRPIPGSTNYVLDDARRLVPPGREFLVAIARDYFSLLQQRDNLVSAEARLESLPGVHLRQDRSYTYAGVRGIEHGAGDARSDMMACAGAVLHRHHAAVTAPHAATHDPFD